MWIVSTTQNANVNVKVRKNCNFKHNPHPIYHPCMREVKSKSKMRPLINPDRLSQQTTSERERSPSQTEGEPTQFEMTSRQHSHSHSQHSPSRPPQTIFILCISAIVLAIASIFGRVFGLISCDFTGFNTGFNVLNNEINNEFGLEKSGLSNEYDLFAVLPASTNDTIGVTHAPGFNLRSTGVGLGEFHDLGYVFELEFKNVENENVNCDFYDYDLCNGYYPTPYQTPAPGPPIVDFIISRGGLSEQLVFKDVFDIVYSGEYDLNNGCKCGFNENFFHNGYCYPTKYPTSTPAPIPQIIIILSDTGIGIPGIDTGLSEINILQGYGVGL